MRIVWCAAVLAMASVAAAQSAPRDTVDGRVLNGAAPAAGIRVHLVRSCDASPTRRADTTQTTGAGGSFAFKAVEPGRCFVVKAEDAKGHIAAQTAEFELAGGNHHSVTLNISPAEEADKYKWLEDVSGERSMAWVRAENERSAKILEADPRFRQYDAEALKIAEDPRRLPYPELRGDKVYNFWRDKEHVHGLLRRTTMEDYLSPEPKWETVIDFDALGRRDGQKWVSHGLTCLYPGDGICMVSLSAGGEDADTEREFDLKTNTWVKGGFELDRSKQGAEWVDKDTLLVARDWGAGTMTTSGYPFVVKEWKRGTPLSEAKEIYRGKPTDMSVGAVVLHDAQGDQLVTIHRFLTFFTSEEWVKTPAGLKKLGIPEKAGLAGLIDGQVLIVTRQEWKPEGAAKAFAQGSLLAVKLKDVLRDPEHLKPEVVFAPTKEEFLDGQAATHDRLIVTTLDHVQGRAYVYAPGAHGWTRQRLDVPDNMTVDVVTASRQNDRFFLSTAGFLTPTTLWMGDAAAGTGLTATKTAPTLFDASNDVVEQMEAVSKDGTKVPYFIVHPKAMKLDGNNPTVLDAYGGFEVSETPSYSGNIGKLWLEKGGVFVIANIRGGGEFGPAWHEAGLNVNRQRIYNDFAAVAEDLMKRKITRPEKLGIMGGSNGGLLMGVEFEQHPNYWNAVVIQVPLLDMIGFEHIAAGASWVGEYGSVTVPEQRAFLESISPYQNLRPDVKYPEPLIFTTTKDDRVGPQHARKFAAKMEEYQLPFYYDEIIEGGHAAGADLAEEAKTWALTYVYLARKLMN